MGRTDRQTDRHRQRRAGLAPSWTGTATTRHPHGKMNEILQMEESHSNAAWLSWTYSTSQFRCRYHGEIPKLCIRFDGHYDQSNLPWFYLRLPRGHDRIQIQYVLVSVTVPRLSDPQTKREKRVWNRLNRLKSVCSGCT